MSIVFSSTWTVGVVADDGDGAISGVYSLDPMVPPDMVATGTVNYFTGLWVLNLESVGFPQSVQAECHYSYDTARTFENAVVCGENGGTCSSAQTTLTGSLDEQHIVPGSLTMVFRGSSFIVGSATGGQTDRGPSGRAGARDR